MTENPKNPPASLYENMISRSPGELIGLSDWVSITQEMINEFSAVTRDPDPMHIDPDWSEKNSPFGETIAFGFLTISMLTHFLHQVIGSSLSNSATDGGYGINYGFDKLRLIAPVRVNARIRGRFTLKEVRERNPGELMQILECVIEIEGQEIPALAAEWLSLTVVEEGHERIASSNS